MNGAERYITAVNERDAPAVTELAEMLRSDPSLVTACGSFADSFRGAGPELEGVGEGTTFAEGADAIQAVLGRHPAFASGRRLRVVAQVLGTYEPDPLEFALRGEAADVLTVGLLALRQAGRLDRRTIRALVDVAIGADAFSRLVRDAILGGRARGLNLDLNDLLPPRLIDLKKLEQYACARSITGAAYGAAFPAPGVSWAKGIKSLDPPASCPPAHIVIRGSGFGATRPTGVEVLFPSRAGGCVAAKVVSWSNIAVEVIVPDEAGVGCVGFGRAGTPGSVSAASDLAGALETCIGPAAFPAAERLLRIAGTAPPAPCPPCLPGRRNRFSGGVPLIDVFLVNDGVNVTVEPGVPLMLRWSVRNAQTISLARSSPDGPSVPPPALRPAAGTLPLGPFTESRPLAATYRLTASNGCGTVTRDVVVELMRTPALAIARIEVVQVIQRPDNSVRLVAGKRTVARVFVDSGVSDGFDWGSGPNVVPGITGTVLSFPAGRGFGASATRVGAASVVAHPAGGHNRNVAGDALMFELPLPDTSGQVRIEARVAVAGHESDIGGPWKASASTTVTFLNQQTQEILPMLVTDVLNGLPAPSIAQFNTSLQEARKRFPLGEVYTVNLPIPLSTRVGLITYDLSSTTDWNNYLSAIQLMMFLFPSSPTGGVRCALVPANAGGLTRPDGTAAPPHAINGIATARRGALTPALMAQSGLTGTFAHEFGHSCGLGHAPCPPLPGTPGTGDCSDPPDGIDSRLPGRTDEVGVDVPAATDMPAVAIIPVGRGELMSYCGDSSRCPGTTRWPSIATWDLLFGTLPIA